MLSHDVVEHVRQLTWVLTDGDFEALVLWCELACHGARHRAAPGGEPTAGARPMLLRELVEATGVPRETARRKLERLAARGRVDRRGSGWVARLAQLDPDRRELAQASAQHIHDALAAARAVRQPV